jgi:hypothetical protein
VVTVFCVLRAAVVESLSDASELLLIIIEEKPLSRWSWWHRRFVVSSAASLTMSMYPHASESGTSHELYHELECTDDPRTGTGSSADPRCRATLAAMDASAVVCVGLRDSLSGWL